MERDDIIEEVNRVFEKFDADENGFLDIVEIKPYFFDLKSKHSHYTDVMYEEFFYQIDKNSD